MIFISISRKELEKKFKRNLIGDAAKKLFAVNLFETVTVEDIAREAEFGKGTLYQYFENKEDILVFVLHRGIGEVCDEIKSRCLEEKDVTKSIQELIRVYYEFLTIYKNLFISFVRWQIEGSLPSHMVEMVTKRHQEKIGLMCQVVERGIKEGVLIDVESKLLVQSIERCINGFNLSFITADQDADDQEKRIEFIKEILFKGILS
ncbi:MAG TPA: TetR/AcrR family transcriptional regulator [Clostridia bacterium]|nr:TetR/AcrR family transcriptional regulator [Clostridia bacterium]